MSRNVQREMLRGNWETLVLALLARGEGYGYQIREDPPSVRAIPSRSALAGSTRSLPRWNAAAWPAPAG